MVRNSGQAMSARRKVVFFAETVTLAHVARPVTLARGLPSDRFDVTLAWDPRYEALFGDLPFTTRRIRSIEPARFLATLEAGDPSYDLPTLVRYVEADLAILDELQPDLVVGDFRLSLSVSARLRGIPYMNITNAYWSPHASVPIPVPDVPPLSHLPPLLARAVFGAVRPFAFARNAGPMRAVHRHFGIPPPPADVRAAYTLADYVAYMDLPTLVPMRTLPRTHRFIGPLLWSPTGRYPDWWPEVRDSSAPKVYVTLGSSGAQSALQPVLAALADSPYLVLLATAGRTADFPHSERLYAADYLPGNEAAAMSTLVICNGGSPTSYQALSQGCPVLGICTNLDQQLNMTTLEAAGVGRAIVSSRVTRARVAAEVKSLLDSGESVRGARTVAGVMVDFGSAPAHFAHWLLEIP